MSDNEPGELVTLDCVDAHCTPRREISVERLTQISSGLQTMLERFANEPAGSLIREWIPDLASYREWAASNEQDVAEVLEVVRLASPAHREPVTAEPLVDRGRRRFDSDLAEFVPHEEPNPLFCCGTTAHECALSVLDRLSAELFDNPAWDGPTVEKFRRMHTPRVREILPLAARVKIERENAVDLLAAEARELARQIPIVAPIAPAGRQQLIGSDIAENKSTRLPGDDGDLAWLKFLSDNWPDFESRKKSLPRLAREFADKSLSGQRLDTEVKRLKQVSVRYSHAWRRDLQ